MTTAASPHSVDILGHLRHDPKFADLLRQLDQGKVRINISGLFGVGQALAIAAIREARNGDILVLTPTNGKAERVHRDILDVYELLPHDDEVPEDGNWKDVVAESLQDRHAFCRYFPPVDLAFLGERSIEKKVVSGMMETFLALTEHERSIVVAPVDAVLRKVVPRKVFQGNEVHLEVGESDVPLDKLLDHLTEMGYRRCEQVTDSGDFSHRGGIVDIFVPSFRNPVRVEFFGDEVESIREFDPETQRSRAQVLDINVIPARELVFQPENIDRVVRTLEDAAAQQKISDAAALNLLQQIKERRNFEGSEVLLPLLFDHLETVFDYLAPESTIVFLEEPVCRRRAGEVLQEFFQFAEAKPDKLPVGPEHFVLGEEDLDGRIRAFRSINMELFDEDGEADATPEGATPGHIHLEAKNFASFRGRIQDLARELQTFTALYHSVVLVVPNASLKEGLQREILEYELGDLLFDAGKTDSGAKLYVLIGELSGSIGLPGAGIMLLGPREIYGEKKKQVTRRFADAVASLRDLKQGDYLVHVDHGIAVYEGLKTIDIQGATQDFLILRYQNDERLYLPMESLHLVQRYVGGDRENVKVDRLGGQAWAKVKAKVKGAIREMAMELLKLYAARQLVQGHPFGPDNHWQAEFEASFEYQETEDQLRAVEEIKADMERTQPMDRLVCGDVGFGKTEVAMRAAFKATLDKKQVAVLVPTTVLAQQHLNTFRKRFESFPVKIEMLSRFRTAAETKAIKKGVKEGEVDIVIGTHMLLGKTVTFKDLGLLIVDEEQRFGVKQKEKLKQFKSKVDVLTLSATPIPRTLHMAISGARDLSIINTAPKDRLPVKTFLRKFSPEVITDAIIQELKRGGQVYFVHNRVEDIDGIADYIQNLVPKARIVIGHGKMKEAEVEQVMLDFEQRKFDILVSTTIIESGLDIPNVNTIIINRADKFGLAQLYQLRGRVGRERTQAYAYLLIPGQDLLSEDAQKRLQVITQLTDLGGGFQLAAADLEVRGSGNLLGSQQSGQIMEVGFDLYCKLIEETMQELQGEEVETAIEPQINLPVDAAIPHKFIRETNLRLTYYQRLTVAKTPLELIELREELADRFGHLPEPVDALLKKMELRLTCKRLRIEKVDYVGEKATLVFDPSTPLSPRQMLDYVKANKGDLDFIPDRSIAVHLPDLEPVQGITRIQSFLHDMEHSGVDVSGE